MGEILLQACSKPAGRQPSAWPVPALALMPLVELADDEDPIECEPVRLNGCAFWRGDWHACTSGKQARITAREFGYGGPGYCFFEMRCARTMIRTAKQDWYLNWRRFTPARGMRLIADYRSRIDTRSGISGRQEAHR